MGRGHCTVCTAAPRLHTDQQHQGPTPGLCMPCLRLPAMTLGRASGLVRGRADPLRLWAIHPGLGEVQQRLEITVERWAQGMTTSTRAILDVRESFAPGMLFVMLSRVTHRDKLLLLLLRGLTAADFCTRAGAAKCAPSLYARVPTCAPTLCPALHCTALHTAHNVTRRL